MVNITEDGSYYRALTKQVHKDRGSNTDALGLDTYLGASPCGYMKVTEENAAVLCPHVRAGRLDAYFLTLFLATHACMNGFIPPSFF